jgi:glycerol-3-phosphate dehydrogenase
MPEAGHGGRGLAGLTGERFDAVVIGGGILGAGVARELARRGQRCLLVEKRDFASGTTSRSTRLVHGGLRYLANYDFGLVREGLRERAWQLRSAPNLVTPLAFVLPFHHTPLWQRLRLRAGLTLYDILSPRRSLPGHRMLDRRQLLELIPDLAGGGLVGGAMYWDAQVVLPERLVIEALRAAEDAGAIIRNHVEATGVEMKNRGVEGVDLTSTEDGRSVSVGARHLINASGPWADTVLARLGVVREPLLRLNQGAHLVYPRSAEHAIAFEHPEDGRLCFAVPWQGSTLVGTTETDIEGDPSDARPTPEEIRYLHAAVRAVLPGSEAQPMWATVGVRSLIRAEGGASRVSRRHVLVDHGDDGVHGLVTVAGGKLTAWRSIAAEVVDDVLARRDHAATDARRGIGAPVGPLPAGADATTERLWRLYGRRASEIDEWIRRDRWWAERLTPGAPAIRAEVAHAVEREWAVTLGDIVLRRLALGSGADLGRAAAEAAAEVAVERLGWQRGRADDELRRFDAENAERRLPMGDGSSGALREPRAGVSEHSSWREPVGLGQGSAPTTGQ